MKSTKRLERSVLTSVALAVAAAGFTLAPAGAVHADDGVDVEIPAPCDEGDTHTDGTCDADAGASLHLDDGVIHLDAATSDAGADRAAQSGCSTSPDTSSSAWWLPLPFAAVFLVAGRRRRRSVR